MIGHIRMLHIRPKADRVGEILPHALILPDAFLTFADERLQSVFLDLLLAVQSQLLFDLQLDRQTVGVPTRLARHHIALHSTVTRDHILDNAGEHMPDVRLTVRRRGAVIKGIGLALLTVIHTFLENTVVRPELFNFFFASDKVEIGRYFLIHYCIPPAKNKCLRPKRDEDIFANHPLLHTDICAFDNGKAPVRLTEQYAFSRRLRRDLHRAVLPLGLSPSPIRCRFRAQILSPSQLCVHHIPFLRLSRGRKSAEYSFIHRFYAFIPNIMYKIRRNRVFFKKI